MRANTADEFWANVRRGKACWEWGGPPHRSDAYGVVAYQGEQWLAHRLAYVLTFGPILPSIFVLHKCDNPPCVRPDHLFLGTHGDNMRDMVRKGRHASTGGTGVFHRKPPGVFAWRWQPECPGEGWILIGERSSTDQRNRLWRTVT